MHKLRTGMHRWMKGVGGMNVWCTAGYPPIAGCAINFQPPTKLPFNWDLSSFSYRKHHHHHHRLIDHFGLYVWCYFHPSVSSRPLLLFRSRRFTTQPTADRNLKSGSRGEQKKPKKKHITKVSLSSLSLSLSSSLSFRSRQPTNRSRHLRDDQVQGSAALSNGSENA